MNKTWVFRVAIAVLVMVHVVLVAYITRVSGGSLLLASIIGWLWGLLLQLFLRWIAVRGEFVSDIEPLNLRLWVIGLPTIGLVLFLLHSYITAARVGF